VKKNNNADNTAPVPVLHPSKMKSGLIVKPFWNLLHKIYEVCFSLSPHYPRNIVYPVYQIEGARPRSFSAWQEMACEHRTVRKVRTFDLHSCDYARLVF